MEIASIMSPDSFENMRRAMVESQLRPEGVTDVRVLDAMGIVAREDFVPESRRATAYADRMISCHDSHSINPPIMTGRLLNAAAILPNEHILIIGDSSGYLTAVALQLTDRLTSIGLNEVGDPNDQLFDVILIDGAVEVLPDTIVAQLASNGRLVTGLVDDGVLRLAIGRRAGSSFGLTTFFDTEMVVLPGFSRPPAFVF
jgi:protein-L-isoaspartate(D-aspartate) O-methyltransferase